ncbi:hypothetical protein NXH76_11940 [Blautia schinkii]|nr:hypothetical protein [Blautia schinkii]
MDFKPGKDKYFVLVEGDEKAAIRDTPEAAEKKRQKLMKFSKGKRIIVYKSTERNG